jgi:hypothetical protein
MHLGLPSAAEMYAAVAASGNIISICVWVLVIFCSNCAYISMPTCRCGWQKNSRPLPAAHTPLLDNRRSQAAFAPRSSQHHPAEGAFSKRAKPTPRRKSPGSGEPCWRPPSGRAGRLGQEHGTGRNRTFSKRRSAVLPSPPPGRRPQPAASASPMQSMLAPPSPAASAGRQAVSLLSLCPNGISMLCVYLTGHFATWPLHTALLGARPY